jgi:hypothetical protein
MKLISVNRFLRSLRLILIVILSCCTHAPSTNSPLKGLRLLDKFEIVKSGQWVHSNGSALFVISHENLSPIVAEKLVEQKYGVLQSFLKADVDPYFGERTQSETCKPENLPPPYSHSSERETIRLTYFYSTGNYVFGACSDIKDQLRAQILWLYCPRSRTLFDIRFFVKKDKPWPLDPVAHCD